MMFLKKTSFFFTSTNSIAFCLFSYTKVIFEGLLKEKYSVEKLSNYVIKLTVCLQFYSMILETNMRKS